jgi:hypothetical protein
MQIQPVPAYSDCSDENIYNGDAKKSQELT